MRPLLRFNSTLIFNKSLKSKQIEYAATCMDARKADYLKEEAANMMADRLLDVKRQFQNALDMGSTFPSLRQYAEVESVKEMTLMSCSGI